MERFYTTTAIDYVNGAPHIGHAYEKILTDVIYRHFTQRCEDTYFLTGTDEHGIKIQKTSAAQGMTPKELCDMNAQKFKDAWKELVQVTSEIRLSGACEKCQNRMTCHSCAAMDYAETGRFSGIPKYLCEMTLEMRKIASEELANM